MKFSFLMIGMCMILLSACSSTGELEPVLPPLEGSAQAVSLMGDTLYVPVLDEDVMKKRWAQRDEAEVRFRRHPDDVDAAIWVGRRTAYLGLYRESIEIYSRAIEMHPENAALYRHRGHRFITVRQFRNAVGDFNRAVELVTGEEDVVEQDGMPNARNIPTSTLQFNIWYHLGLAHYLLGAFENALEAYESCMAVSSNPDARIATTYWMVMTLWKLGRTQDAESVLASISGGMDIIENDSYYRLLLMFKGMIEVDQLLPPGGETLDNATVGYGIGNWHLVNGREKEAECIFESIISGSQWAAFGSIAAEAELARWRSGD